MNILIHIFLYFILSTSVCRCVCVFGSARVDLRKNNRRYN